MNKQIDWEKLSVLTSIIGKNKSALTLAEKNRFKQFKASLRNIREEGFTGGESGASMEHVECSTAWLAAIVEKYQLNS